MAGAFGYACQKVETHELPTPFPTVQVEQHGGYHWRSHIAREQCFVGGQGEISSAITEGYPESYARILQHLTVESVSIRNILTSRKYRTKSQRKIVVLCSAVVHVSA